MKLWRSPVNDRVDHILVRHGAEEVYLLHTGGEMVRASLRSGPAATWVARKKHGGNRFNFRPRWLGQDILTHSWDTVTLWSAAGMKRAERVLGSGLKFVAPGPDSTVVAWWEIGWIDILSERLEPVRRAPLPASRAIGFTMIPDALLVGLRDRVCRVRGNICVDQTLMPERKKFIPGYPRDGLIDIKRVGATVIVETIPTFLYRLEHDQELQLIALGEGSIVGLVDDVLLTCNTEGLIVWRHVGGVLQASPTVPGLHPDELPRGAFRARSPGKLYVVGERTIWLFDEHLGTLERMLETDAEITAEAPHPFGGVLFSVANELYALE